MAQNLEVKSQELLKYLMKTKVIQNGQEEKLVINTNYNHQLQKCSLELLYFFPILKCWYLYKYIKEMHLLIDLISVLKST